LELFGLLHECFEIQTTLHILQIDPLLYYNLAGSYLFLNRPFRVMVLLSGQVDRDGPFQYQVKFVAYISLSDYHLFCLEKFVGSRSDYFYKGSVVQVYLFEELDRLEKRKQPNHLLILAFQWWLPQHIDLLADLGRQRHHLVGFLYERTHHERLTCGVGREGGLCLVVVACCGFLCREA